jgi:hypothetical protein
MIRQRINAGLKRAKAQGKQLGRPRIDAAIEKRVWSAPFRHNDLWNAGPNRSASAAASGREIIQ